jgi:hypothetical protein
MSTLNDQLTVEDIAYFRELGACADGLAWCESEPRTWGECIDRYAAWLLEHSCDRLTDERFAAAVARRPWAALEYPHATARIEAMK